MIELKKLRWLTLAFCTFLFVLSYFFFGIEVGGDGGRYSSRGGGLLDYWFSDSSNTVVFDKYTVFYLIPNLIAGIGTRLWGEDYETISIIGNVIFYCLMVFLIFRVWELNSSKYVSAFSALLAVYLVTGLPAEILKIGMRTISSDVIAMSFSGIFLYFIVQAVLTGTKGMWLSAVIFAFLSVLVRPSGIVTVMYLVQVSVIFFVFRKSDLTRMQKYAWLFLLILPSVIVVIVWPYLMAKYDTRILISALKKVYDPVPAWSVLVYKKGWVVKNLETTWVIAPTTWWDFILVALKRCYYFAVPIRAGYSTLHLAVNLVYLAMISALIFQGWRKLKNAGGKYAILPLLLVSYSCFYMLFYSMLIVDEFRYQLPYWPSLWILAGFGLMTISPHVDTERAAS